MMSYYSYADLISLLNSPTEPDYVCPPSHPWVLGKLRTVCCAFEYATEEGQCDKMHMK